MAQSRGERMKERTITAMLMAVVMVPILVVGNEFYQVFSLFCLALSGAAAWEFTGMRSAIKPMKLWIRWTTILLSMASAILFYLLLSGLMTALLYLAFVFASMLFFMGVFVFDPEYVGSDLAYTIIGILYVSIGFSAIAWFRDQSVWLIVYLLLTSMLTDTFAYLFGIRFGRHKLAPLVSPKKSVEGAMAGLVLGGVLSALFASWMNVIPESFVVILLLSFALSIAAQVGDLVASAFKREANIKDYSDLFPGHGGVLDRFDSTMFAGMVFIVLFIFLGVLS